jgi:dihydroxyacetone synthase
MIASGWEVINVFDGRYDVRAIVSALDLSKNTSKPVFINIRTVIGVDMASAGTAKAHHGGFDEKSITASKQLAGLKADSKYEIPEQSLKYLRSRLRARIPGRSIRISTKKGRVGWRVSETTRWVC